MRKYFIMVALAVAGSAFAEGNCTSHQLRFTELPFAEGKLFVSVSCGDATVLAKAIEVEEDTVTIPADLSVYDGKVLNVQAFQDLNENNTLDFDGYGRPTEPCLQTVVTPGADIQTIDLKLVQY